MKATTSILVLGLAAGAAGAGKPAKEPAYASDQPLYGKVAFDLEGKTVAWSVIDRGPEETVLYFDLNANGDLTDDGERFELKDGKVQIGDFVDPNSGLKHTALCISHDAQEGNVMFRMDWKGKDRIAGGYSPKPGPYLHYTENPEKAPTIAPVAEGPFQVQPWMLGPLKIGRVTDVKFFLGHAGTGTHAFCAVKQDFLPAGDGLQATLIYTTNSGEEKQSVHKLLDRC